MENIADVFGTTEDWYLTPNDKAPQALIFEYPNITARGAYIHQAVKIEMGTTHVRG